jgi:hypothetical protein
MSFEGLRGILGVIISVVAATLGLWFGFGLLVAQTGFVPIPLHRQPPTKQLDDLVCPPLFLNDTESATVAASIPNATDQDLTYRVDIYVTSFLNSVWNRVHTAQVAVGAHKSVKMNHTIPPHILLYDQNEFFIVVEVLSNSDLTRLQALPVQSLYEWHSSYFGQCPVFNVKFLNLTGRASFIAYCVCLILGLCVGLFMAFPKKRAGLRSDFSD